MKSSEEYASKIFNLKLNEKDKLLTSDELITKSDDCDGILSSVTDKLNAGIISKLSKKLKLFSNFAVGFGNIDIDAAKKRNIVVTKYSRCFNRRYCRNCDACTFGCSKESKRREWVG